MTLSGYTSIGGIHPETASIRNILTYHGIVAPHTGQPYTEALLLGIGAPVEVSGPLGRCQHTALQVACMEGHADIVRLLLDHDASLSKGYEGESPLAMAACEGQVDCVRVLLGEHDMLGTCDATALRKMKPEIRDELDRNHVSKRDQRKVAKLFLGGRGSGILH